MFVRRVAVAIALSAFWCISVLGQPAAAATYGFTRITNNAAVDVASDLLVDLNPSGANAAFKFYWGAYTDGVIAQIYFDDDASVLSVMSIGLQAAGVDFEIGASPGNLPGGNSLNPNFSANYASGADNPAPHNGVNSLTDFVTILFSLHGTKTVTDVIAALNEGTLRLGLHVQSIDPGDKSDSFVNLTPVPLPAALWLFGSAIAGLGLLARHRQRAAVSPA